MKQVKVVGKTKNAEGVIVEESAVFDFPETIQEASEQWGEEACLNLLNQKTTIGVQNLIRGGIQRGASAEDIQASVNDYKPGERRTATRKDPKEAAMAAFGKMTREEQEAYLKELKAQLAGQV